VEAAHEAVSVSEQRSASACRDAGLVVDVLDVVLHGARRDAEGHRDLLGAEPAREVSEDLGLAIREARR